MLTQQRLKELLSYNPDTGEWTWLVTRGGAQAGRTVTHKEGSGYIQFTVDRKNHRACRLAWLYMTGEWPSCTVDHKDRNRANDRWDNLRLATRSQNSANSTMYANNSTGYKGVTVKRGMNNRPFCARIDVDGKGKHLGYFATASEAGAAYMKAAQKYFGEFACNGGPA